MSNAFRDLLRKIGSGTHTTKDLTRSEAESALTMILTAEATPAQIGAFLIAHRIKRPTVSEMAGMLDAYDRFGGRLEPLTSPVVVLGSPYDGRSRTAPISPMTGLVLATAGINVIMHGGDRMPTKAGLPLIEIWQGLGLPWQNLSLLQVHAVLAATGLGFIYLPHHFPLAQAIVTYRDQIGKRPPLATLEMMWSPYIGDAHIVCGFVHPPTETIMRGAFALRGCPQFTTVKGSEGSCDLPRDRTAIIGLGEDRLFLAARDYGFSSVEVPFTDHSTAKLLEAMLMVLQGSDSELARSLVWNSGFYLWRFGVCSDIEAGFKLTESLLSSGRVYQKLLDIAAKITNISNQEETPH
jgi:anthranilate phosphoribosyltransferase